MNSLITRGLAYTQTQLELRGMLAIGVVAPIGPGWYRGYRRSLPVKLLVRDWELKRLEWKTEEINPTVLVASISRYKTGIPITIAHRNSENIRAQIPIADIRITELSANIAIAHPSTEYIEAKFPVAKESSYHKFGIVNVFEEPKVIFEARIPAVFSKKEENLEIEPIKKELKVFMKPVEIWKEVEIIKK